MREKESATTNAAPVLAWKRYRFQQPTADYRPVKFPPPGPYWCTGYTSDAAILVAYLPADRNLADFWPEARAVEELDAPDGPRFTDRFPKPEWWSDEPRAVWYEPTPGLRFAGVVLGAGTLPDTLSVNLCGHYWVWKRKSDQPSQWGTASAIAESSVYDREVKNA